MSTRLEERVFSLVASLGFVTRATRSPEGIASLIFVSSLLIFRSTLISNSRRQSMSILKNFRS